MTIEQTLAVAAQHQRAGNLQLAETLCRQILASNPDQPVALHVLGLTLFQASRPAEALPLLLRSVSLKPAPDFLDNLAVIYESLGRIPESIEASQKSLTLRPDSARPHFNLGNAFRRCGNLLDSIDTYRRAIAIEPNFAAAHTNLGASLTDLGFYDQAIIVFQTLMRIAPNLPDSYVNLGYVLLCAGRTDDSINMSRRALQISPNHPDAFNNLGNALRVRGQLDESIAIFLRALQLRPNDARMLNNLSTSLILAERFPEALAAVQQSLRLRPDFPEALCNLGNIHQAGNRQEEAAAAFQRALVLNPGYLEPINNLGVALKELALPGQALAVYAQGMKAHPDNAIIHSNWLNTLNFLPDRSPEEIFTHHVQWGVRHANLLMRTHRPHANDRFHDRPLRIGYLSPDLRQHSVAFFLISLLETHDRAAFHVTCYSTARGGDFVTERIERCCGPVRDLFNLSDDAAAEAIRRDSIDILVDLAGHTAHNGLAIMARKPAPVQVTYLGYPNTTGMQAIDWRLTDHHADPDGAERFHTESLLRLPRTAWCFSPLSGSPPIVPSSRNHTAFGCFGDLAKMNAPLLQLWSTILHHVPNSRLILKHRATANASVVRRFLQQFQSLGISSDRVELIPPLLSQEAHLQAYAQLDIALDTYPYHGTTTTCEALWMGVPVITQAGPSHASRVGVSLLTNIGLDDLIANTPEQYVQTAIRLAGDRDRLAQLRHDLRPRMQNSPLMDAPTFAREIEIAYRTMWHAWLNV